MAPACIRPSSQSTNWPRLEGTHALTGDSALAESSLLDLNLGADTRRHVCLPMTGYFHHDRSLLKPWVTGCVDWTTGRQLGQRLVCSNSSDCVLTVIWSSEWLYCFSHHERKPSPLPPLCICSEQSDGVMMQLLGMILNSKSGFCDLRGKTPQHFLNNRTAWQQQPFKVPVMWQMTSSPARRISSSWTSHCIHNL